jgi:hypothetical protein
MQHLQSLFFPFCYLGMEFKGSTHPRWDSPSFFFIKYTGEWHHCIKKKNVHRVQIKHIPRDQRLKHLCHKEKTDPQPNQDQLGLKHEFGRITQYV